MALRPAYSKSFKKDWKRIGNRGWDMEHLKRIMSGLAKGHKLSREYGAHLLKGQYKGHWECRIEPDFLLIWRVTDTEIRFTRTGTHADLFGL